MSDQMNVRACAIVRRSDRILFLAYDYARGRVFCLPGGGVQSGETVAQALTREFHEELSVVIEMGPLAYLGDMLASDHYPRTLHVVFQARIIRGEPKLNPQFTTAKDFVWLPVNDLQDKILYPAINAELFQDLSAGEIRPRYLGDCLKRQWL